MSKVQPISNDLLHLSSSIEEADGLSQVHLLLKLNEILARDLNVRQRAGFYEEIWKFKFPSSINRALHQDFNLIRGSWKTACQLVALGVECCLGCLSTPFRDKFLQEYTETMQQLLSKMLKEYASVKEIFQANLRNHISSLVTTISSLVKKFKYLSCTIVMSKHFMQFLMTEDSNLSLLVLGYLKNLIVANKQTFDHTVESRVHNISDELAFKLSSTNDVLVAKVSTEVLLLLMDVHKPLIGLFSSKRYRGFKTYMMRWKGRGFDFLIDKLISVLDSQTEEYKKARRFDDAAIVIQSVYRGYRLRVRISTAKEALAVFQKNYRDKKQHEVDAKAKIISNKSQLEYELKKRRNEFISSKVKQLQVIKDIPAATIDKFFLELQHNAASKIQAAWLGSKTRSQLAQSKPGRLQHKAAVTIQRQVRKWLARRRQWKQEATLDLVPGGLTDARRFELQAVIANIRERYPKTVQSDDEFQERHEKAFSLLNNHFMKLKRVRRRDDHRKALLAQLSIQAQQMASVPTFKDVTSKDVESFSSYSSPVVIAARQRHQTTINELKKPWWAKINKDQDELGCNSWSHKTSSISPEYTSNEKFKQF